MLTLQTGPIGDVAPPAPLPAPWVVRSVTSADVEPLGQLYFDSYPPGLACSSVDGAVADIEMTLDGEYGQLWPRASLVVTRESRLVAAVLTVRRPPWPDTPNCPFVVELFTAPQFRRRGLARHLVRNVLAAAGRSVKPSVALRVADENDTALRLYRSLGFEPWRPDRDRNAPSAGRIMPSA